MKHGLPCTAFAIGFALTSAAVAEEQRAPLSTFQDCEVCPEMVVIPAGDFMMGSPPDERGRYKDEGPRHMASLESFNIGAYEVTFAQYDAFAEATGRKMLDDEGWGRESRPVIGVALDDAVAYAQWLSEKTGKRYRLPTAAEWEYTARAGSTSVFPWGDDIGNNRANCNDCGSQWDAMQTAPVGSFAPNAWGLHDTVGNVWEWTCSKYGKSYAGEEMRCADFDEYGYRSTRSGSWKHPARKARTASQHPEEPRTRYRILGFRLAREL